MTSSDTVSSLLPKTADIINPMTWMALGESVRGASHVRHDLPNQDSLDYWPDTVAKSVALAVSDGHGSTKCFRSDRGSQFAVDAAMEVMKELAGRTGSTADQIREIKLLLEDGRVARSIFVRWNEKIKADLARDPLATAKHGEASESVTAVAVGETAGTEGGTGTVLPSTPNVFLSKEEREPYGATLLVGLITDKFGLFLQLGDGDMVALTDAGDAELVFDHDPEQIANETKSLCGVNPLPDFRSKFQVWSGHPPKLLMLSTDGYPNSFSQPEGFLKAVSDIHGILSKGEDGELNTRSRLRGWLRSASEQGSGDDVTVGVLYRANHDVSHREPADIQSGNRAALPCDQDCDKDRRAHANDEPPILTRGGFVPPDTPHRTALSISWGSCFGPFGCVCIMVVVLGALGAFALGVGVGAFAGNRNWFSHTSQPPLSNRDDVSQKPEKNRQGCCNCSGSGLK